MPASGLCSSTHFAWLLLRVLMHMLATTAMHAGFATPWTPPTLTTLTTAMWRRPPCQPTAWRSTCSSGICGSGSRSPPLCRHRLPALAAAQAHAGLGYVGVD
eukprot:1152263-Pelagomonas_calceolata.AAC.1